MGTAGSDTDQLTVTNPANGSTVGAVSVATPDDVVEAAHRARAAQVAWARVDIADRVAIMRRFHDLLLRNTAGIVDIIQAETGKSRRDALSEMLTVAGTVRYYLPRAGKLLRSERRRGAVPFGTRARLDRRPIGLAGFITPWNYPLLLSIGDAVPALLAGNAAVIKPSEQAPLSCEIGVDLLYRAGLPEDLVHIVNGDGESVGQPLIGMIDHLTFTGSSKHGRVVASLAGSNLIPCTLELGGKNPMIVLEGANIKRAARGLMNGAFANGGQNCLSIERVYVESSVYDEFVEAAVEATNKLTVGWAQDWTYQIGSMISEQHADHVESQIVDALDRGADLLAGGERLRSVGPAFIRPTMIGNVDDTMKVLRNETFGPVVTVTPVRDRDEAIERANATRYGLNASVWAGSNSAALDVARSLEAGSVGINATQLIFHSFDVPMGGAGASGIGRRHAEEGLLRYTEDRSIVTSATMGGGYDGLLGYVSSDRRAKILTSAWRAVRHMPGIR